MPERNLPKEITVVDNTVDKSAVPATKSYEVEEYEQIGGGEEGVVYRVQIKNEAGQLETYALKVLHEPVHGPELEDNYLLAKQAGLPVPEFFKTSNDGLLMSDLTDNGKNLVFSSEDVNGPFMDKLWHTQRELMETFSKQDISKLKKEIKNIAERASQAQVSVDHEDGWFFVMKPSGEMSFVLTDMLHVKKGDANSYRETSDSLSTFLPILMDAQGPQEEDDKPFWR